MKNTTRFLHRLVALTLLLAFSQPTFSQTYETDFGWQTTREVAWDGIPIPNLGTAVSLSNTDQLCGTQLMLTKHNAINGAPLWTSILAPATSTNCAYTYLRGRALGFDPENTINPIGFHITGNTGNSLSYPDAAFLLRTNANGQSPVAWRKATRDKEEIGMVVEEIHGNVLVAGNSTPIGINTGNRNKHFWAARFIGNLSSPPQWSFYYTAEDTTRHFVIHEGCMGRYKTAAGGTSFGLALSGYYYPQNGTGRHTFVSLIDWNSGVEIWRTACPSGVDEDEGIDIVQDPESLVFLVVGYARKTDGQKRMYSCAVDQSGVFLGGSIHGISVPDNFRDMVARDVCLSVEPKKAVATGYVVTGPGQGDIKTFALQLSIEPASVLDWTYYFPESFSDLSGSEAINRSMSPAGGTAHYLITTGGRLYTGDDTSRDAQVIKILFNGTLDPALQEKCEQPRMVLKSIRTEIVVLRFPGKKFRTSWNKMEVLRKPATPDRSRCFDR
ncbi:MAG: hypothetical protein IT260_01480 [Saprospiraceae bacterium]|nr:hypothetical protein [Saprospiraceae bacterium]